MPESFDSMLAELADAAGGSVALPDLAAVRRRAGQRTVRRRMTASAIAFALLCVTGVAGAAIDGRFGRPSGVNTASAPSGSSAGATGTPGSATPSPSATASSGAAEGTDGSFVGVWENSAARGGYLMVFPDGVVGLSETGGASLCYGRVSSGLTASQTAAVKAQDAANSTATAPASTSTSVPSVSASNSIVSPTPSSYTFALPFSAVECDGYGLSSGLALAKVNGESGLTLTLDSPSKASTTGYQASYARVLAISSGALSRATVLTQLVGDWTSISSAGKQTLRILKDGSVMYETAGGTIASTVDFGTIGAYYSVGARVLTGCTKTEALPYCGVLLIQPGASASEVTVYSGSGPATFTRTG